jgi:LPXTG-motif cell wall-anchored protein
MPQTAAGALPATGATALLPWSGAFLLLGMGLLARRRRA